MNNWTVYLLESADGKLYCGITTDITRRLKEHIAGTASKCTRRWKKPFQYRALRGYLTRSQAAKLEAFVKKQHKNNKWTALRCTVWTAAEVWWLPPRGGFRNKR